MNLSENEGIEGRTFVVTGGAGHVGSLLCLELARRGAAEVRSLDTSTSSERLSVLREHGIKCVVGEFVSAVSLLSRFIVEFALMDELHWHFDSSAV